MVRHETVECSSHGVQPSTFVCQHLFGTLSSRQAVGFWWSQEDDSERPDAWCTACKEQLESTDQQWTPQTVKFVHPKLICGACYDVAYEIGVGERRA
jgi:hypothetical protein